MPYGSNPFPPDWSSFQVRWKTPSCGTYLELLPNYLQYVATGFIKAPKTVCWKPEERHYIFVLLVQSFTYVLSNT